VALDAPAEPFAGPRTLAVTDEVYRAGSRAGCPTLTPNVTRMYRPVHKSRDSVVDRMLVFRDGVGDTLGILGSARDGRVVRQQSGERDE